MGHLVHLDVDTSESNGSGTSRRSTIHARIQWGFHLMLLRPWLFTVLDYLPLRITSLLLRFVHEITCTKLIVKRIGHASVHEAEKSGEKKYTDAFSAQFYITVRDSGSRVLSEYDRTMGHEASGPQSRSFFRLSHWLN